MNRSKKSLRTATIQQWLPNLLRFYRLRLHLNLWQRFQPRLFLLRRVNQCRRSAVIAAAAKNAKMASLRAARRQKRLTVKKTRRARLNGAMQRRWRHCRRHCRVFRLRLQTQLCRRLLVWLVCLLLWLLLVSLPLLLRLWHGRKNSCPARSSSSRKSATACAAPL